MASSRSTGPSCPSGTVQMSLLPTSHGPVTTRRPVSRTCQQSRLTVAPDSPLQELSLAKADETLAALDRSQMWVEGQYLPYLQRAGLISFVA